MRLFWMTLLAALVGFALTFGYLGQVKFLWVAYLHGGLF